MNNTINRPSLLEKTSSTKADQFLLKKESHIRNKLPLSQGLSLIIRYFSPTFRTQDKLGFSR